MSVVRFRLAEARKYRQILDAVDIPIDTSAINVRPHSAPAGNIVAMSHGSSGGSSKDDNAVSTHAAREYIPVLTSYAQSLPARDDLPASTSLRATQLELRIMELTAEARQLRELQDVRRAQRNREIEELDRRKAIAQDWALFTHAADAAVDRDVRASIVEQTKRRQTLKQSELAAVERDRRSMRFAHPSAWGVEAVSMEERSATTLTRPRLTWMHGQPPPLRRPPLTLSTSHREEVLLMRTNAVRRCEDDESQQRAETVLQRSSELQTLEALHNVCRDELRVRSRHELDERSARDSIMGSHASGVQSIEVNRTMSVIREDYKNWRDHHAALADERRATEQEANRRLKAASEAYSQRVRDRLQSEWEADHQKRTRAIELRNKLQELQEQRALLAQQLAIALREDEAKNRLRAETVAIEQRLEYRDEQIRALNKEFNRLSGMEIKGLSAGLD